LSEEKKRKRKKSRLQERLEYATYRAVLLPVRVVSPRMLDRWASILAATSRRLVAKRTELARRNLAVTFPERSAEEREQILRACWKHFSTVVLRFLRGADRPIDEMLARIHLVQPERLDRAIARGRGLIVVTAHFGDWEHALAILSRVPQPVTVVARELDNELLDRDLFTARVRGDIRIVDRRRAARALIRTLEQAGSVVILPDQAVKPREGILVPFLGRDAWTTPAPARLSLRSGAPVLCAYCIPTASGLDIFIDEPMLADESAADPVEELTRRINDSISTQIRAHPELWLWMHDRWKKAGGTQ
jgi:KDO2-lipid IV(A) lauroyltransferase